MKQIVTEIRDNYEHYSHLVKNNKKVLNSPIIIEDKNPYWEIGSTELLHLSLGEKLKLDVQNCKREKKYSIQLFCTNISNVPIFRFDSAGPRHRNKGVGGITLEVIDTPHFHVYSEQGREMAYQTEILKNPKECEAIINDIDFGISHFCFESKSFLSETMDVPVCGKVQQALDFGIPVEVDYNKINFDDEI